tara:strand:- start:2340 stop:2540 length:201 start_codon:yes stop_codon:yes gene_type:complete
MTNINKIFFEDLHKSQINQINTSQLKQARKVILGLLTHVSDQNRHNSSESDDAILHALEWLKNNQS